MIRIGVIGYGYWGPNLVRNVVETPGAELAGVSDLRAERLKLAQTRHPTAQMTESHRQLIEDPAVDAIAIATPVSTHYELALAALRAGKHVLVEKPLTASTEQALRLVEAAQKAGRVLMVDHTFVYTPAVRKIRELVDTAAVGDVYYYDSTRVNLGLFQHDVNVLWDLAIHDLSIIDHVLPRKPVAVSTTGLSHVPGRSENIAFLTLFFDSPVIAHIHVNWLAPVKIRRTLIGASKKMIVYDDMEPSEKIKIYDRGITLSPKQTREEIYELMVGYRAGDMHAPNLEVTEALRTELSHFVKCIEGGTTPITDGEAGLRIVRILEAASESMRMRGEPVQLGNGRATHA
jgi:predicted dehydrogenase